jgi:uncharacterized protein (DUF2147 family)
MGCLSFLFVALCFASSMALAQSDSPVGAWKTIDDKDEQPRSIVEIVEEGGEYKGSVRKLFPRPEDPPGNPCEKCTGERKDKPVVGMTILWGLKRDGKEFTGGEILDPNNGKIYRCKMKLSEDGKKLLVRGFIGISLIGRTQTWLRER